MHRSALLLPLLWLVLLAAPPVRGDDLAGIPLGAVSIDGRVHPAYIADDDRERGQGFQNVPEERIRRAMIYFRFERPVLPSFHMRNVAAPLAIAWIDADHRVARVDIMRPGRSGYAPPVAVIGALEVHPSRLQSLGLTEGATVRASMK